MIHPVCKACFPLPKKYFSFKISLSSLGNRAGRGYNPNQQVVVGGRSSVDIGEHKSSLRGRGSRHSSQGRGVSWAPDVDKDFDRSAGMWKKTIIKMNGLFDTRYPSLIWLFAVNNDRFLK